MTEGRLAFVTGGSGFIGGRLIEVLIGQCGMRARTFVRGSASAGGGAFRAAAAGAEVAFGSLLDEGVLAEALRDVDVVFHCAYGTHGSARDQREVTVEGTRRLARAAGRAGVRHLVHLGTIVSYGGNTPPVVPEDYVNPKLWRWPYAHDKLAAEQALAEEAAATGLPYTILRLGMVYGPYGGSFTLGPLNALSTGRLAMVDDGAGVSNATYVDDVVQAMILAAKREGRGERFVIRGPDRVTWREFYERYDGWLGKDALVGMSRAEMKAERRAQWVRSARGLAPEAFAALKASAGFRSHAAGVGLRGLYSRFSRDRGKATPPSSASPPAGDTRPIQLIPEVMVDYFANRSIFSIDRAREVLGYRPAYDLDRGMALTEQWARWANLLPEQR